jgi:chloride channel 3/4/5
MSLRKSQSIVAIPEQLGQSGTLVGPSSTTWRRQRLLGIGQEEFTQPGALNEQTALRRSGSDYGSIPTNVPASAPGTRRGFRARHRLPALPNLELPHEIASASNPTSPRTPLSFSFREYTEPGSYLRQRPISAYDSNLVKDLKAQSAQEPDSDTAAMINGIRVWYSSFTGIDWLHDAIKDSVRRSRLHRRKSLRGRIRLAVDRSIGWVIVTIVGMSLSRFPAVSSLLKYHRYHHGDFCIPHCAI